MKKLFLMITIFAFYIQNTFANNPFVDLATTTTNESITTSGNIMSSPIGYLIYFVIAFIIIMFIIKIIINVIGWGKGNVNNN